MPGDCAPGASISAKGPEPARPLPPGATSSAGRTTQRAQARGQTPVALRALLPGQAETPARVPGLCATALRVRPVPASVPGQVLG